jgi:hypothetical protein
MQRDDRIPRLLEVLRDPLDQQKLELLTREFGALAQDRAETLLFFVLQNVCRRLASALEGEAVSVERLCELTAGIAEEISAILQRLGGEGSQVDELGHLVSTLYQNLGLYRI